MKLNQNIEQKSWVTYEVNLHLKAEILAEYREFLRDHVKEMLKFDGFLTASIFELSPTEDEFSQHLTVHYKVESMHQLQNYLDHSAAQMREQAVMRFGERFKADRRVLINSIESKSDRMVKLERMKWAKNFLLYLPVLLSAFPLVGVFAAILGIVVGLLSKRRGVILGSLLGIAYFIFTVLSLRGVFT